LTTLAWIFTACAGGTLLSLAIAALVAFRVQARWIPTLVSFAVGALLGAAFLDLLPHLFEESRNPARTASFLLAGILIFFVLEKLMLWRHHHHHDGEATDAPGVDHHDHGRSGWMIVIGDGFHNFTDGVIIASAFIADVRVGAVTALAIVAHEIPSEIGNFLVLLHSGFGRAKALFWNAMAGLASVTGGLIAFAALHSVTGWIPEILALSTASMIYVAVADLIPGLHRRTALAETVVQVVFIAAGVGCIALIHAVLHPE
jgi:zinc and cadmium transporter